MKSRPWWFAILLGLGACAAPGGDPANDEELPTEDPSLSGSDGPPSLDRDELVARLETQTNTMSLTETLRFFGVHVEEDPSARQVRAAFRRAALLFHPDRARGNVLKEVKFGILRAKLD